MNNNDSEPTLLTRDAAATLLKSELLEIWNADLEEARSGLPNPDSKHWQDTCQRELYDIGELETYDEVYKYFREFVYNWEPRPDDLLTYLLELFIEGETSTTRP